MRRLYKSRGRQGNIFRVRVPLSFLFFFRARFTSRPCPNVATFAPAPPRNFRLDVSDIVVDEVLSTLGSASTFIAKYNVGAHKCIEAD